MSSKRERDDGSDSGEDDSGTGRPREGKRRPNRACDSCRKKKHRCDGDTSEAPCSTCKMLGSRCTYLESSTRKAVPKGYVDALEARVATLMEIVSHDRPNVDLERLLGGPLVLDPAAFNLRRPAGQSKSRDTLSDQSDVLRRPKMSRSPSGPRRPTSPGPSHTATDSAAGSTFRSTVSKHGPPQSSARDKPDKHRERGDSEDEVIREFVQILRPEEIAIRTFLGKSSALPMMTSAIAFKYGANGSKFHQECALHPLSTALYFNTPSWEHPPDSSFASGGSVFEHWPDPPLASSLIDLYFAHANEAMPLLQRSHFLQQYASQLYFRDEGFARVCLLVFARGAGYSNDLRVRSISEDGDYESVRSAGWIYYHALAKIPCSALRHAVLFDLQLAVLQATFLHVQGSRATRAWAVIGAGLKAAIEVGAHRRALARSKDAIENELMRKAFWCLYLLDVEHSSALGRPVTLGEDEFDVELEFDHAFWQDGAGSHPSSPPSAVQAFCLEVELARILARTCTLLYGIKRPHKSSLVIVNDLEEQIKEWTATVPAHLRWDASRPNSLEFRLSGRLQMAFQTVLTYIHRPFLPSPPHPVSASPTSVTAAFKAAVESIAVYDEMFRRTNEIQQSCYLVPQMAATILALCVWAGPQTHKLADPAEAMGAVDMAVSYLELNAKRFSGVCDALVPTSVLAAPRVDYLVESGVKRQDRERRVAQAVDLQRQQRLDAVERSAFSPVAGRSPSSGLPSVQTGGGSSGSPSTLLDPTPPPLNSGDTTPFEMLDFFNLGEGFMFPDLPSDHDPAMTLFLERTSTPLTHSHPTYNYPFPAVASSSSHHTPFFGTTNAGTGGEGMPHVP